MIKFLISLFLIPSFPSGEYNLSSDKIIVSIFAVINIIFEELSPLTFGDIFKISINVPLNITSTFFSTEIGFSENLINTSNKTPIKFSSLLPEFIFL